MVGRLNPAGLVNLYNVPMVHVMMNNKDTIVSGKEFIYSLIYFYKFCMKMAQEVVMR